MKAIVDPAAARAGLVPALWFAGWLNLLAAAVLIAFASTFAGVPTS